MNWQRPQPVSVGPCPGKTSPLSSTWTKPGLTIHDRSAQDPTCSLVTHRVLGSPALCCNSMSLMSIRSETLQDAKRATTWCVPFVERTLGQPQHRIAPIRTVPESSADCADVWLGLFIIIHPVVARPSAVSRLSDQTITHTPKGVAGLPGREQNWKSQAGAAFQCISTEAPLNKLAIAGHLWL